MMHLFASELAGEADTLGGDALAGAAPRRSFLQPSPDKLAEPGDLVRAVVDASKRGAPVLLMGASFAFVHVFDALRDERLVLPPDSRIMHTGGFKGRSREVAPDELRARMATTFGVAESAVVGEYGMTELSSQLYEGTLRAARGAATPSARHGVFVAPPWLRVAAADPDTLEPLPEGEIGILRFEDLANVDSALIVQTADRGRCGVSTVELLGRSPGAVPRGCSLTVEELMGRP
jgi:acyl-CoA synthetase (AMP-forming)/AMP-acid ligase II